MSEGDIEARVGAVETQLAVQGEQLRHVTAVTDKTSKGVEQLLERDARRTEGLNLKSLAGACAGIAAIAVVGWWLVEHSPAITALRERITDLDHPTRGSVTVLQRDVEHLKQWQPTVLRFNREAP